MSFVPLSDLLNKDTQYLKTKAEKTINDYEKLNKIYQKNKDPEIKKMMKIIENEVKKDIKFFELSEKLSEKSSKELSDLRKNARKILK
jgi:vacuolar-type H+-ATPase catalytic subunit A/Vma1